MKESISFLSTYAATDRQEEPQWYQKLPIFTFSQRWGFHNFVWIGTRESLSLLFVGFIVVVEGNYASAACDFDDIWAYNVGFLQIADCYFSFKVIRELFSPVFKASTSYRLFSSYVVNGIFAHWLSLHKMLSSHYRFRLIRGLKFFVVIENLYPCSFKCLARSRHRFCLFVCLFVFLQCHGLF